ncbi:nuclear pore membrane glycoprotein 210-like [Brachyhypopomus gauderio]|uniref:nuclear pore membrane glycoprotein 210-like n=1 Tax=Brachyhypopomus gauderio TaxID=698409 RepID=UPI004042974F
MTFVDLPTQTGYKLHGRQMFESHGPTGTVNVTVILTSSVVWGSLLSLSVNLQLVEDVLWDQHSITLYNHPGVNENLTPSQGSGHVLVRLQDKDMANITFVEKTKQVQMSPLCPGFTSVLAHNMCVSSPEAALAVTISDIFHFQIDFMDAVEVGRTAVVRVQVLDCHRQPFLHHFLTLMELKLLPSSPIVTVEGVSHLSGTQMPLQSSPSIGCST